MSAGSQRMSAPGPTTELGPLREDERRRRRVDALLVGVLAVVAADRDDLAGSRQRGEELRLREDVRHSRGNRRRRRRGGDVRRRRRGRREVDERVGSGRQEVAPSSRGPPSRSSAAARQPSPTTTPRVSPVAGSAEIRRTWAPGVQYSGRWTMDWTIRYGDRRVNRLAQGAARWPSTPSPASHSAGPASASPASASAARRSAASTRPVADADAHGDRPPGLGPRNPALRHGAALRLRRVRAAGRGGAAATSRATTFVLSTKVGRLVRRPERRSRPAPTSTTSGSTAATTRSTSSTGPERIVFDYSADGVRRSIEESLGAARPRPDRHRPDPRPGRSLAGGDRRGVPGPRPAPRGGRDPGHRRRA